jgi:hypothetical protein
MKTIAPNLYIRGKHGNIYVRRRIPKALKEAYPPEKTHETVCLHTSDVRVAKVLQRQEELRTDIEFKRRLEEFKKSKPTEPPNGSTRCRTNNSHRWPTTGCVRYC